MTIRYPLNFAVIGCGTLARSQHIPNILSSHKAQLHTCCDTSDDSLSECRKLCDDVNLTNDFRAAIANSEVDAVVLATTERLRLPVIAACADAGKPIYIEKPLARTLDEVYHIQKVVRDSSIPCCVGHNRRASPAMLDAHRIFRTHMQQPNQSAWRFDREGPSGRPPLADDRAPAMSIRINDDWYSWKDWVFDKSQAPHGPMLFEMTHFTDLSNWFMANRPVEVIALDGGMLNHGVVIRYEDGGITTILMGSNGTFGYPKELYEVMGNGGVVVVDHMLEVRTVGVVDAEARVCYPMLGDRNPAIGVEGGLSGWLAKKRQAC